MKLARPAFTLFPTTVAAALAAGALLALPASATASTPRLQLEPVAEGLQNPWAMAAIGDGRWLVTERPGRMRVVEADGRLGEPLAGVPAVAALGQGGLLDVITDRDFARNRRIHFCFSEPGLGGNSTAMASATLSTLLALRPAAHMRPERSTYTPCSVRSVSACSRAAAERAAPTPAGPPPTTSTSTSANTGISWLISGKVFIYLRLDF